jgi:nucleoid-associated protein YgaU
MPGKTVLRLAQIFLFFTVAAVVVFGRKDPTLTNLTPASIDAPTGQETAGEITLRRASPTQALPYTRQLVDIPPLAQRTTPGHPAPTASPVPSRVDAAQIPFDRQVRRHRIVEGDTIQSIAQTYLGDAGRFMEIVAANHRILTHPEVLPLGKYLVIPPAIASSRNLMLPAAERSPAPDYIRQSPRPLLPVQ